MTPKDKALALAKLAHRGQKYGGVDYFKRHVADVVLRVRRDPLSLTAHEIVAALHDVVEDTPVTIDDLFDFGFSRPVIHAVHAITRKDGEDYLASYIPRLKRNDLAAFVKRHDLESNINDTTPEKMKTRNRRALEILKGENS